MTFLWPDMLWLLLSVPALVAGYIVLVRRKKKAALRYANLSIVKEAMGAGHRFRRHIPPMLFLAALAVMIAAIARPAAVITLPSQHETVILAMDTSGSMRATDVDPSRIAAAQAAARAFVSDQPRHTRIGVVAFAGTASVVQAPTQNREEILAAIDRFQLQRATAIGSGILVSLKTIFPDAEFDLRSWNPRADSMRDSVRGVLTIADVTRGEYFYANTATDLKKIYQALTARLVLENKETEITALFSAAAAVLAFLAALLSLLWFNHIL